MKKLFIYYSHTGNGEQVASCFENKGYELRRVYEKKKMPKAFFFQMLAGGFRAGTNQKGKLVDYNNDVSEFEEVVIGSPIWNGNLPPAINAVLEETDLKGKRIAFILYSGSGTGKKAVKKLVKLFGDSVNIIFLQEPKKYPEEFTKLNEFFNNQETK